MRFCKLRQKEVVNVIEGCSLGYISDLVIDECTGKICALVVPDRCGLMGFFKTGISSSPGKTSAKSGRTLFWWKSIPSPACGNKGQKNRAIRNRM